MIAAVRSGRERQGATELDFPGLALGEVQDEAPRLAGEPSAYGEETSLRGLGGCRRRTETDRPGPEDRVVSHHLHGQSGGVGHETSGGEHGSLTGVCKGRN